MVRDPLFTSPRRLTGHGIMACGVTLKLSPKSLLSLTWIVQFCEWKYMEIYLSNCKMNRILLKSYLQVDEENDNNCSIFINKIVTYIIVSWIYGLRSLCDKIWVAQKKTTELPKSYAIPPSRLVDGWGPLSTTLMIYRSNHSDGGRSSSARAWQRQSEAICCLVCMQSALVGSKALPALIISGLLTNLTLAYLLLLLCCGCIGRANSLITYIHKWIL